MSIDRAIRIYEAETARKYDEQVAADCLRAQFAHIDFDGPRPHGTNPAVFDGPCDCDDCQAWDTVQRWRNAQCE